MAINYFFFLKDQNKRSKRNIKIKKKKELIELFFFSGYEVKSLSNQSDITS